MHPINGGSRCTQYRAGLAQCTPLTGAPSAPSTEGSGTGHPAGGGTGTVSPFSGLRGCMGGPGVPGVGDGGCTGTQGSRGGGTVAHALGPQAQHWVAALSPSSGGGGGLPVPSWHPWGRRQRSGAVGRLCSPTSSRNTSCHSADLSVGLVTAAPWRCATAVQTRTGTDELQYVVSWVFLLVLYIFSLFYWLLFFFFCWSHASSALRTPCRWGVFSWAAHRLLRSSERPLGTVRPLYLEDAGPFLPGFGHLCAPHVQIRLTDLGGYNPIANLQR